MNGLAAPVQTTLAENPFSGHVFVLVLGRRNYLFAGSDAGGERAANIYSLIGSVILNGMDPYLYLRHVLERIAEHPINASKNCCRGTSLQRCSTNDGKRRSRQFVANIEGGRSTGPHASPWTSGRSMGCAPGANPSIP